MRWLFRAKNTIKIRSKKSHVDHGGKWHIAAYWCSFTTKFKKQKSLLSSQHSQKYEKQNTKGVIMYIKRKEHVLSLGFSTIIYCTNLWQNFCITWDHLLYHTILLSYQWTKINTRKIPDTVFIKSTHFKWTINPVLNSSYLYEEKSAWIFCVQFCFCFTKLINTWSYIYD